MSARKKFFFGLAAAQNVSDITTSFFRFIEESVRQGHEVIVWTCGAATMLTHRNLTESKPRNLLDIGTEGWHETYPSTVEIVERLIAQSDGRLTWYICRHCMQDRGVTKQSPLVHVSAPHKFVGYRDACDLYMFSGIL